MILASTFQGRSGRAAILIVAMVVAVALVSTWVIFRRRAVPSATSKSGAPAAAQNQTISVAITSNGFSPTQATCFPGKLLLVISNQSGGGNLVLRLTRVDGQPIAEFGLTSAMTELRQEVSLDAGEYTLKDVNHSSWILQITAQ